MERGQVRAAVWAGILGTFVAAVAGYWFPAIGLPLLDLPSLSGQLLVPVEASAAFAWTVGLGQLFGGGVILALIYGLYVQMHLPGPGWVRGMIWGGVLALIVGVAVVPLLHRGGTFGTDWGGLLPISLIAWHLLWGFVVGIGYHKPRPGHRG